MWLLVISTPAWLLLSSCGEEGDSNNDTLLGGISGVVILAIVAFLVVRATRKKG